MWHTVKCMRTSSLYSDNFNIIKNRFYTLCFVYSKGPLYPANHIITFICKQIFQSIFYLFKVFNHLVDLANTTSALYSLKFSQCHLQIIFSAFQRSAVLIPGQCLCKNWAQQGSLFFWSNDMFTICTRNLKDIMSYSTFQLLCFTQLWASNLIGELWNIHVITWNWKTLLLMGKEFPMLFGSGF